MIVQKICQNKLNYTTDACGNLTENEEIQDQVQRSVTDYEAQMQMLALTPRLDFHSWQSTHPFNNNPQKLKYEPVLHFQYLMQQLYDLTLTIYNS